MITCTINGQEVTAPAGTTILEAARLAGIRIPTLCYLKGINEIAACRMCVVEVTRARTLMAACTTQITPGMEIQTHSPKVVASRRRTLTLLCQDHHLDCEYCPRFSDCELHTLFVEHAIPDRRIGDYSRSPDLDQTAPHLIRDTSRCILCRRCVSTCRAQGIHAIDILGRGRDAAIGSPFGLGNSNCIHCGACIAACPTGALFTTNEVPALRRALEYKDRHVIALIEPAVYAALGESFREPIGTDARGKTAAFLRAVGFEGVYDLSREDDGRLAELRAVFLHPESCSDSGIPSDSSSKACFNEGFPDGCADTAGTRRFPLISSVDPAVVSYAELNHPAWESHLSRLPYPAAAVAGRIRQESAERLGCRPEEVVIVSVSGSVAQKAKPDPEIDIQLTTRELAKYLRIASVSLSTSLEVWRRIEPAAYDNEDRPVTTFLPLPDPEGAPVETELLLDGTRVKACVVSGLVNGLQYLEAIKQGRVSCDYLEIWANTGGPLAGGGQPRHDRPLANELCVAAQRAKALA